MLYYGGFTIPDNTFRLQLLFRSIRTAAGNFNAHIYFIYAGFILRGVGMGGEGGRGGGENVSDN